MRIEASDYRSGERIVVEVMNDRITSISPANGQADIHADWLAPSFFDVQINGCLGHSFNSPNLTIDAVHIIVAECVKHGIGGMCPTLVTNSFAALQHGFRILHQACEASDEIRKRLPRFHLEGPYLSAEDGPRGAHPRTHIRKPDWDEFRRLQEAAGGRIGMVTLSPEYDEAMPFIEKLCEAQIVAAIGHTAASPARIRDAVRAGAKISTHLGNGCHAQLPRHENYIWEQLAADNLWASVISDGHHLPASLLKCIVRVKSPLRTVLTCDASSLAGLAPGRYTEWGAEFEVHANGRVSVPGTPFLAGSGVFLDTCVSSMIEMAGVSLQEAVDMASARPRELMNLPPNPLDPQMVVEVVAFNWKAGSPLKVVGLFGSPN